MIICHYGILFKLMLVKPFFCLLFLLCSQIALAEIVPTDNTVAIRTAKHQSYLRIVFEGPQFVVQKASVVFNRASDIKVTFTHNVSFILSHSKEPLQINKKTDLEHGLSLTVSNLSAVITVANIDDIKVMKLEKPSRLIIDAYYKPIVVDDNATTSTSVPAVSSDLILIDAGHGGSNTGFKFKSGTEKDFVFNLAKDLSASATKAGIKTVLSKKTDTNLSYTERLKIISHASSKLVLSLHLSGSKDAFVYTDNTLPQNHQIKALADKLASDLETALGTKARHISVTLYEATKAKGNYILLELPSPELIRYDRNTKKQLFDALLQLLREASK